MHKILFVPSKSLCLSQSHGSSVIIQRTPERLRELKEELHQEAGAGVGRGLSLGGMELWQALQEGRILLL